MNIIGKQKSVDYFQKAIKNDALHHFYVLEGAEGVGKKTLAKYVAAMLHCTGEIRPCGVCAHCVKHKSMNHPDFTFVREHSDKRNMSVDTVRGISEDIYIKPLLSDRKIYLIDDSKPLGTEAQNAFLKILEEPPSYALIFLSVINAQSLLPTVLSRAIRLRVDPCSKAEIIRYLHDNYPLCENAELISGFSGGIIGMAENMANDSGYFEARGEIYTILSNGFGSLGWILELEEYLTKNQDKMSRNLNFLLSWLRDALCVKCTSNEEILNYDYKDDIVRFSEEKTTQQIIKATDALLDICRNFTKGNNAALWTVNLLTNFS